jgi:hypothetical protein
VVDCSGTVTAIENLEQAVLDQVNAEQPDPAALCAAYHTYVLAVQTAQTTQCAQEIPASNLPDGLEAQCGNVNPRPAGNCAELQKNAQDAFNTYSGLMNAGVSPEACAAGVAARVAIDAAVAAGCDVTGLSVSPDLDSWCAAAPVDPCAAALDSYNALLADANASVTAGDLAAACTKGQAAQAAFQNAAARGCNWQNDPAASVNDWCARARPGQTAQSDCEKWLSDYNALVSSSSGALNSGDYQTACLIGSSLESKYQEGLNLGCPLPSDPTSTVDEWCRQAQQSPGGQMGGGGNVVDVCSSDLANLAALRTEVNNRAAQGDIAGACQLAAQNAASESQAAANGCDLSSLPAYDAIDCSSAVVSGWRGWY